MMNATFRNLLGLVLFALAACPANGSHAQKSIWEYDRRVWKLPDGLPEGIIQAITQTQDGYLWIGTRNGLARFDGFRFTVFDHTNTSALHDDSVLALWRTSNDVLWIGTEGGGLLRFSHGSFESFRAPQGLTNGFVRAIHEDGQGNLLVGTDDGLFRLSGGQFVRVDGQGAIPLMSVHAITVDEQGRTWVGGWGLFQLENGQAKQVRLGSSTASQEIKSIFQSTDHTLWVGTVAGLYRLKDGVITHIPIDSAVEADICEDHAGNLWVGWVGGGLSRFQSGHLDTYRAPAVLPGNTVLSIFEDSDRNLWVGTDNGLLRLSYTGVSILQSRSGQALGDDSTIYENVGTIYEDREGTIWIANGHLYRVSGQQIVPFTGLPSKFSDLKIRTVFKDSKGVLWIGTGGQGVVALGKGWAQQYTEKEGLVNVFIRAFCEDRRGSLWIGTDGGVARWDGKHFQGFKTPEGLAYLSVRAIVEGEDGNLWVGTDGGLSRIHNSAFVRDPSLDRLHGERIWAIHEDAQGVLWVGTRGDGLFRLKDGKLWHYTTQCRLPNDSIYQILEDRRGNLWMSSPGGVFRGSLRNLNDVAAGTANKLEVAVYGTSGGLPIAGANGGLQPAGTSTRTGELWFPTFRGAIRIQPDEVQSSHPRLALIERVIGDGRVIPLSSPGEIRPGDGQLEIYYTAPSLQAPERTRFKYMLEGFDHQWTHAGERRVAYYTNLPPGHYRFRVVAYDADNMIESPEADFSFTWSAHFYQTIWFYVLCGLCIISMAWTAFRIHLGQTRARYAMILAERARLAREMHDTVIQGCVGVSTLLEAISGFEQSAPDLVSEFLERARMQIRQTLNEAREAVWDLRHSWLEGERIEPALSRLAKQLERETGAEVTTEVVGSPCPLNPQVKSNLLLAAREAARNSLAHGNARNVAIRLSYGTDQLCLEVTDNGCGFDPESDSISPEKHYGIVGMRERIEQLGGTFQVLSRRLEGTHVIASIPLGSSRTFKRLDKSHEALEHSRSRG